MRKNCIRHWVHAICDLLPLLVIPIFALQVRSDNGYQPISITIGEDVIEQRHFNQLVYNGKPTSLQYWDDIYPDDVGSYSDNKFIYYVDGDVINGDELGGFYIYSPSDFDTNYLTAGKYLFTFTISDNGDCYLETDVSVSYGDYTFSLGQYTSVGDGTEVNSVILDYTDNIINEYDTGKITISFENIYGENQGYVSFYNVMLINLTYMYGAGNEATINEFFNDYDAGYYDFTYDTLENIIISQNSVTYNDTDVGSQMVYTLYNTCDKYFNFNSVGTFNGIYQWFEVNLFNGPAPLSFFIVWNVILYEFIMDLIFLTYMVFMFVIDFTEHMIDSFFAKSYRGGR